MKVAKGVLAALCALAVTSVAAGAGTALSRAQYRARLRAANAAASKAEDAAVAALRSKKATAAQVKARFFAMGRTQVQIGKSFATLVPPKAATKANRDFAHAEIVLGHQNEASSKKLPSTKAAIAKYVQPLPPPSGGKML